MKFNIQQVEASGKCVQKKAIHENLLLEDNDCDNMEDSLISDGGDIEPDLTSDYSDEYNEVIDISNAGQSVKDAAMDGLKYDTSDGIAEYYVINDDLFWNKNKLEKFITIIADKFEKEIITKEEMQKVLKMLLLKNMINIEKEANFWGLLLSKVESLYEKKVWTSEVIRHMVQNIENPENRGLNTTMVDNNSKKLDNKLNYLRKPFIVGRIRSIKNKFNYIKGKAGRYWFGAKQEDFDLKKNASSLPRIKDIEAQNKLKYIHKIAEIFYLIKNKSVERVQEESSKDEVNSLYVDEVKANNKTIKNQQKSIKNVIGAGLINLNNSCKPKVGSSDIFSKQEFINIIKKNGDLYNFHRKSSDIEYFKNLKENIVKIENSHKKSTLIKNWFSKLFYFLNLFPNKLKNIIRGIKEKTVSIKTSLVFYKKSNSSTFKKNAENQENAITKPSDFISKEEEKKKKAFKYQEYDVFASGGWGRYRRKIALKPVFFVIRKLVELLYNIALWLSNRTFNHSLIIYILATLFILCGVVLALDFYLWLLPVLYLLRSFFKYFILFWLYFFSQYDILHLTWFLFTAYIVYRMVRWVLKKK